MDKPASIVSIVCYICCRPPVFKSTDRRPSAPSRSNSTAAESEISRAECWNRSAARRNVALHDIARSDEHTSELQSLMRISYAVFCLKKKIQHRVYNNRHTYNMNRVDYSMLSNIQQDVRRIPP